MLLVNMLEEAADMEFVLTVFVRKDGTLATEWSHLQNGLTALGAIEALKLALIGEAL